MSSSELDRPTPPLSLQHTIHHNNPIKSEVTGLSLTPTAVATSVGSSDNDHSPRKKRLTGLSQSSNTTPNVIPPSTPPLLPAPGPVPPPSVASSVQWQSGGPSPPLPASAGNLLSSNPISPSANPIPTQSPSPQATVAAPSGRDTQVPNPLPNSPSFPTPTNPPTPSAPPTTNHPSTTTPNPFAVNLNTDDSSPTTTTSTTHVRRQKRLERNRESARLSRRRRKHYLEVLEERVSSLSEEMDIGRRNHVHSAVPRIRHLRHDLLEGFSSMTVREKTIPIVETNARTLCERYSRVGDELRIAATFQKEQLKSLVVPPHCKFVLWLTLQNDGYFRGGRAVSERLSAARIGEKMLQNGSDRVAPSGGMWPLLCNEINLSYDQEERVRNYQRSILQTPTSWIDVRHTALASDRIIQSHHKCVLGLSELIKRREYSALDILTVQQRVEFLAWAHKRKGALERLLKRRSATRGNHGSSCTATAHLSSSPNMEGLKISHSSPFQSTTGTHGTTNQSPSSQQLPSSQIIKMEEEASATTTKQPITESNHPTLLNTSPTYHTATNLYILNNHLQTISQTLPTAPPLILNSNLKRLSRRPSFESLASRGGSSNTLKEMSRENSSNSLKRRSCSLSEEEMSASAGGKSGGSMTTVEPITPEKAHAKARPLIMEALKPAGIQLPVGKTATTSSAPMGASSQTIKNATPFISKSKITLPSNVPFPHPTQQQQPNPIPSLSSPNNTYTTTPTLPQFPNTMFSIYHHHPPTSNTSQQDLPPVMNVVPEEDELQEVIPAGAQAAEDFLMDLAQEDWAIGGFDIELDGDERYDDDNHWNVK